MFRYWKSGEWNQLNQCITHYPSVINSEKHFTSLQVCMLLCRTIDEAFRQPNWQLVEPSVPVDEQALTLLHLNPSFWSPPVSDIWGDKVPPLYLPRQAPGHIDTISIVQQRSPPSGPSVGLAECGILIVSRWHWWMVHAVPCQKCN